MAYDALKELTPQRAAKEYVRILELAARQGEAQVDEVLRELLERKAEVAISATVVEELLTRMDSIPPVTQVEVTEVDLASFDQLYTDLGVQA